MKRSFIAIFAIVACGALLLGCSNIAMGVESAASETAKAALPNLTVEMISHTAYTGWDGMASVVFTCRVYNRGTAPVYGYCLGGKGWTTPTISTPTGYWCAQNALSGIPAGQYRDVILYGPGYVGSKVQKGSRLTVTAYADIHASVAETSETDNSRTQTITVGY